MKRTAILILSLALAVAAGCDDKDDKPAVTSADAGAGNSDGGGTVPPGSDGGTTPELAFVLTEWVHDLVTKHTNQVSDPDTVDDKEGRLQITEDETAFDPILMQQSP